MNTNLLLKWSLARELLNPADVLGLTLDSFYRTHGGEKQRIAWDINTMLKLDTTPPSYK